MNIYLRYNFAMKRIFIYIVSTISVCLLFFTTVYAADENVRFMRNDHDVLMIGEISSLDENKMVIDAVDFIVSEGNMWPEHEQLRPKTATVTNVSSLQHLERIRDLKAGDYVIASLNKEGDVFSIAWGLYQVDALDYKTLNVIANDAETSAVFTDFVNSGGTHIEFSNQGNKVTREEDGKEIIVYEKAETSVSDSENNMTEGMSPNAPILITAGAIIVIAVTAVFLKKKQKKK